MTRRALLRRGGGGVWAAALFALALAPAPTGVARAQESPPAGADSMAPGKGEIRVRGVVRSVEGGGRKFLLDAQFVTGPDGRTEALARPRPKTVSVTTTTLVRYGDPRRPGVLSALRPGVSVIAVGENRGVGVALPARIILIGAPATPTSQNRAKVTVGRGAPAPVAASSETPVQPAALPAPPEEVARTLLARVNLHRREAGLGEVTLDARLSAAAQLHSEWMARERRLDHRGRGNTDPSLRAERVGYLWSVCAENIAQGPRTADEAMGRWLASVGHRRNLLKGDVVHLGVGVSGRYWTLMLAAPRYPDANKPPHKP